MSFKVPIALFVFRRLDTVKLIIEKLVELQPEKLYVFGDAAREGKEDEVKKVTEVREYIKRSVTWNCDLHLEYAEKNLSCSPNIRRGFNQVLTENDCGIFLEDDAVPLLEFFKYCDVLLEKYKEDNRIQYIAGFNGIGDNDLIKESYSFSKNAPMSGAIATWSDRWLNVDWKAENWPVLKEDEEFRKALFSKEFKNLTYNAFEEINKNGTAEWDIQFAYDQYLNKRYAIVPKGNLVRNYISEAGAFHPQTNYTAKMLQTLFDYTKESIGDTFDETLEIKWNQKYDKRRQYLFLRVRGNYIQRKIKAIKLFVKTIAYKVIPEKLWKLLKKFYKSK